MLLAVWSAYGFYLWAFTTLLLIIALVWLGWNTFAADDEVAPAETADLSLLTSLGERVTALEEATPHMQATLGRTLQFWGLERYADAAGGQAFSLAVTNARGEGFVLSSSVRGGLMAKPLSNWISVLNLTNEEQAAIAQARAALSGER